MPRQPSDPLLRKIEAFTAPKNEFNRFNPPPRMSNRLHHAIARVRDHICGLFGAKASAVSDVHVARFVIASDENYLWRNMPGIGPIAEGELETWAWRLLR